MAAFRGALSRGFSFECDIQKLRSGEVVILHDDTLERTAAPWSSAPTGLDETSYRALVSAPTGTLGWDQVKEVDVGSWFETAHSAERVPTFSQALKALKASEDGACFAELKSEVGMSGGRTMPAADAQLVAAAEAVARTASVPAARLTWISFSRSMATEMKRRMPEHSALLIAHARAPEEAWAVARYCVEAGLDGIDLNADEAIVTPELVQWLKARGKLTAVWVFRAPSANDTPALWAAMRDAGVDYFTSNLPAELEAWRAEA